MYKIIILFVSLGVLIGCSQTKVKVKKIKKIEKQVKVIEEKHKTIRKEKKEEENKDVDEVLSLPEEEFVPEHIRLSHIEVVPH